ncbi:MAG TPA: hypothetical protein VGL09_14935 [Methylomirabilota bacterium]|jgi:hypothetical protein
MTLEHVLYYVVVLGLPVLLVVEEIRKRRRPQPPIPARSPVRNPSEERVDRRESVELKAS